jgi:CRP-like cAMP-binding protein
VPRASALPVSATASIPPRNHLLASLSAPELEALGPRLRRVKLPLGKTLYESGQPVTCAYFPTTSIVSLHYVMRDGASAEVADVGNEGMLGISLLLGGDRTTSRAAVHTAGEAYVIGARALHEVLTHAPGLQRLLLRYTQALIAQMTQTAGCIRHHSIEQQVSRWLLRTLDRMPTADVVMTQEHIAAMLGVRRESVTEAAQALKSHGLIRYHRGCITVLDRPGLSAHACECYAAVKGEFDRLLRDFRND